MPKSVFEESANSDLGSLGRVSQKSLSHYAAPIGAFFVLKFVRSRGFGARFLQPFPESLATIQYDSNTKMAVNSRQWPLIAVNGR